MHKHRAVSGATFRCDGGGSKKRSELEVREVNVTVMDQTSVRNTRSPGGQNTPPFNKKTPSEKLQAKF